MSQSIPQSVIQNKQLTIQLSKQEVMLSASQTLDRFEVTVYNDSDRFASFQLKLLAAGIQAETHSNSWYRLTPSVSSKIPAGDCTHFQVEIFELPPIAQQFRGSIDLTVEVTSRELQNQYDRKSLRLLVKSLQTEPPKITLTIPPEVNPSESLRILAQVYNPTTVPVELLLRLQGLPESWFSKGIQQAITLPGEKLEWVTFEGEVPSPLQALSYDYPVQLEVTGRFPIVVVPGRIQILPAGQLLFSCDRSEGSIPEPLGRWQNPAQGMAEFILQVDNQSNLEPDLNITVQDVTLKRRMFWQKNIEPQLILPGEFPPGVTIGESPATLTSRNQEIPLQIQRSLPWLGWARLHRFEIGMTSTDPLIAVEPDRQIIQLHLFPRIPFWLQILGALLALGLGALAWLFLIDPGHRGPVTSLKFNGQGTEILSGSDDQTLRRWRVQDQNFQTHSRMNDFNKAIRVTRYRPVNNDQIAIGFENGEIQLANLLTGERSRLTPDKDDRVLDIIFSRDARTLYSGHGSGLVLQWDMTLPNSQQSTPKTAYNTQFAIQTMALVGNDDHILAIAGRYNRIVFLNTQQISPPQKNIPKKSRIQNPKSRIPGNLTPSSIVAQPTRFKGTTATLFIQKLLTVPQADIALVIGDRE